MAICHTPKRTAHAKKSRPGFKKNRLGDQLTRVMPIAQMSAILPWTPSPTKYATMPIKEKVNFLRKRSTAYK
jgi:hypothetical protein